jgi:hypothetical protein
MFMRSVRRLRIHSTFVLIPLAALLLAGCSSIGGGVMGTYVASPEGGGSITLELKSDNRATVTLRGPDGEAMPSAEGAWKQEGDQIITTIGTDQDSYTLKDGDLTINAFGEDMVFEKQ